MNVFRVNAGKSLHLLFFCGILFWQIHTRCDFMGGAEQSVPIKKDRRGGYANKTGGDRNVSNFNETTAGSRRPFRTSDKKMEP